MVLSKGAKIEGIDADGSDRFDIDQCESDKLSWVGQYAHDLEFGVSFFTMCDAQASID